MARRIFHYKIVMGAVLAVLTLGILGGLFVLQFITIARGDAAEVRLEVVGPNATAVWSGEVVAEDGTALGALRAAAHAGGFPIEVREYPGTGAYVVSIAGYVEEGGEGWLYCVGDPCRHPGRAANLHGLSEGDLVRWHWGSPADGL